MLEKFMNEDFFSLKKMPDRIPNDPLRSLKNISFVINTLLRKASEKGGLHPFYIHSISEKFAIQIEKSSSIRELIDLHDKMMFEYCDSVKKFSLKNYNYITRKAIEFIRLNLDKNLSLEGISSAIDANSYELSRQFNKETGQTITEYINKQRINEAIPILDNQNISITSIAHMVGFNDVNYFTKVFKQLKGITPSQYRKSTT
jgi:YesN/AraC family two-component response regulator